LRVYRGGVYRFSRS